MFRGIAESIQSLFSRKLIPLEPENDFIKLVTDAMKYRMENNSDCDDFLAHIIQTKEKKSQSDAEAAAHAWTFILDSFDTSAIVAHQALYEVAKDKRVQEKLRYEIMKNLDDDGSLSIEKLLELQYLDQVFYEILRLHPPFMFTTKVCSEEIELDTVKGHKFTMKKGATVMVSIHSIHRDPEYYPDPLFFNPERFNEEHGGIKSFRDRCVLIPFGDGPRICLGMNFGIVIVKSIIAETLINLEISVSDKTPKNLEISPTELLNVPCAKIMLNFKPI